MKGILAAVLIALASPALAQTTIAGCPNDNDLMWCLKRRSDARWVDRPDGTLALRKNRAMRAYEKRFLTTKEH